MKWNAQVKRLVRFILGDNMNIRWDVFSVFMLGMVIGGSIVLGMFALVGY